MIVLYDSLICQRTSGMLPYCIIQWHVSALLGCYHTVWFSDMSLHFWVVIKLLAELINRYTFGMWSYIMCCMSKHFWDVVPSLTQRYPSRMWSCCRIHRYVSKDVRCEPTVCFTDMSVHFCDVILLYVSLICQYTSGCDPTVRFTDM